MPSPGRQLGLTFILLLLTAEATAGGASDKLTPSTRLQDFLPERENQAALTFSPDAKAVWWVEWDGLWGQKPTSRRQIVGAERNPDAGWTAPAAAPFATGEYDDDDPFISPDGRWLYFSSNRPPPAGAPGGANDIWRFNLKSQQLEYVPINSSANETSPAVSADGTLYFVSDRQGGMGQGGMDQGDIYVSKQLSGALGPPQLLGPSINSTHGEWNVWISPDRQELIFEASSRPTNVSIPGDLYYSWRSNTGWTPAVALSALNSTSSELLARITPTGSHVVFTRAPLGGHAELATAGWSTIRQHARWPHQAPLWVVNRSSHELMRLDLAAGQVAATLPTGAGPHLLSNVSEGRIAVTGYGVFPEPHENPVDRRPPFVEALNSRLTLIDAGQNVVARDWVLADCLRPHASWIVEDRVYVTCEDESTVQEIDLASGDRTNVWSTQANGSHVLAYEPASEVLGVTNTEDGSIVLIEPATGNRTAVALAAGSEGLLAVDGLFWVANAMDGSVSVVDPSSGRVTGRINDVCSFPIAFGRQDSSGLWVACFGSSELVAISIDRHVIEQRVPLEGAPLHVAIHPCLPLAYVSLPRQNAVAEVDLNAGRETRRFSVGIEPDGLRFGPHACRVNTNSDG